MDDPDPRPGADDTSARLRTNERRLIAERMHRGKDCRSVASFEDATEREVAWRVLNAGFRGRPEDLRTVVLALSAEISVAETERPLL